MKRVGWSVFALVAAMAVGAQAENAGSGEGQKPVRGHRGGEVGPMPEMGGPDRQEMLKKFDKDGDGKLSPEERQAMREARKAEFEARHAEMLKKFDTDGDGQLSETERQAMREARKAEMLKKFDKDGDGKLSDEEKAAMPKPPQRPGRMGGHEGMPPPPPPGDKGGGETPPPPPAAE